MLVRRASAPQPDRYMCVSGMRGKKTESRLGENSIITISEQQKRRYSGGGGDEENSWKGSN